MPSPDLSGRWSGGMWLVSHVEIGEEAAERLLERGIPDSMPEGSLAVLSAFPPSPDDRIVAVEQLDEGKFIAVVEHGGQRHLR